ncbi:cysteine dioxygenase [Mytilus galloprovincialis]|uniref:Cysteine dioxygenase n=1 Tax=Mytilus galloprovincialis TaxID=29158 RepID=A0A8B6DGN9_MYTGA|nr:cysteine dioxygenase [Mytilus galloprovincialis]
MNMYKSNPKDWKKFAKFDPHRYTRNLVDEGNGKFNLMILCWNTAQASSIHDHANSHCFLKVIEGHLNEELFDWPENEEIHLMEPIKKSRLDLNEVGYMSDELGIHRIENPSHTDNAVSLHLYCPPFDECQTFDQFTGHKRSAEVTFWSKFGKRTPFGKEQSKKK